jgi:hypothetical protein
MKLKSIKIKMNFKQIIFLLAAISIIYCQRNLQNDDKKENDACSSIKAKTANDCFSSSVNSAENKCCSVGFSLMNQFTCRNFKKGSDVYNLIENKGGIENMNIYLNTKMLGTVEASCSAKNQISDDIKTLANNCGSLSTPSFDGCAAMSNENVQCCFYTSTAKALGGINIDACAGIVAPVKMPSFSMSKEGEYNGLMCGVNSQQKNLIDTCGTVVPTKADDCSKMSKDDITCKFASYEKTAGEKINMCIGYKGDLQMMMDLGIEPRLRVVSLKTEGNGFERIGMSYTFLISLILFSFVI